ncbi:hypothetical protein BJV74DRAFT_757377, partial [Russula compacta]
CVKWYIFQGVGTQLLVAAVEFILIIRVHLQQVHVPCDRKIALFLMENVIMIFTLEKVIPGVCFDTNCTVIHSPPGFIFFATTLVAFETILFVLTLIKFLFALRNGWGCILVLFHLVCDGTWAFILIF